MLTQCRWCAEASAFRCYCYQHLGGWRSCAVMQLSIKSILEALALDEAQLERLSLPLTLPRAHLVHWWYSLLDRTPVNLIHRPKSECSLGVCCEASLEISNTLVLKVRGSCTLTFAYAIDYVKKESPKAGLLESLQSYLQQCLPVSLSQLGKSHWWSKCERVVLCSDTHLDSLSLPAVTLDFCSSAPSQPSKSTDLRTPQKHYQTRHPELTYSIPLLSSSTSPSYLTLLIATLLFHVARSLHETPTVLASLFHSLLNIAVTLLHVASKAPRLVLSLLLSLMKDAKCGRGYRQLLLSLLVLACLCGSGRTLSAIKVVSVRGTEESDKIITVPLKGSPNTGYSAEIVIGVEGNQKFGVLIDTGSANFAIAGKSHPDLEKWFHGNESSSFEGSGRTVSITYTEGEWRGELGRDVVMLGGSEAVEVNLVVISYAEGFYIHGAPWQGILGMAYSSLAKPDSSTKTLWDIFRPTVGLRDVFSLQLCPPLDIPVLDITESKGGTMVLGGVSVDLYHGNIVYTPIVEEQFYSVLVSNISVGDTSIDLHCREFNNDKTIVDSGTTDIFFNEKVFDKIIEVFSASLNETPLAVPDGFWIGTARLAWPVDDISSVYSVFPTLYLSFAVDGNETQAFSLAVTPQIYLRQVGGTTQEQIELQCYPECDFFKFGIKKRQRGTVIGSNVMLGFVTVFDRENKRIGFAETTCQQQIEDSGVPHIIGPFPQDPINCVCSDCGPGLQYWEGISYTSTGVVGLIAITAVVLVISLRVRRCYQGRGCHYNWIIVVRNRCFCCCIGRNVQERSRGIEEGTPFVGAASFMSSDVDEGARDTQESIESGAGGEGASDIMRQTQPYLQTVL